MQQLPFYHTAKGTQGKSLNSTCNAENRNIIKEAKIKFSRNKNQDRQQTRKKIDIVFKLQSFQAAAFTDDNTMNSGHCRQQ